MVEGFGYGLNGESLYAVVLLDYHMSIGQPHLSHFVHADAISNE